MMSFSNNNNFFSSPFEPFTPNPVELGLFYKALSKDKASLMTSLSKINSFNMEEFTYSPFFYHVIFESFSDFISSGMTDGTIFHSFKHCRIGAPYKPFLAFLLKIFCDEADLYMESPSRRYAETLPDLDFTYFVVGIPISEQKNIISFLFSSYFGLEEYAEFFPSACAIWYDDVRARFYLFFYGLHLYDNFYNSLLLNEDHSEEDFSEFCRTYTNNLDTIDTFVFFDRLDEDYTYLSSLITTEVIYNNPGIIFDEENRVPLFSYIDIVGYGTTVEDFYMRAYPKSVRIDDLVTIDHMAFVIGYSRIKEWLDNGAYASYFLSSKMLRKNIRKSFHSFYADYRLDDRISSKYEMYDFIYNFFGVSRPFSNHGGYFQLFFISSYYYIVSFFQIFSELTTVDFTLILLVFFFFISQIFSASFCFFSLLGIINYHVFLFYLSWQSLN